MSNIFVKIVLWLVFVLIIYFSPQNTKYFDFRQNYMFSEEDYSFPSEDPSYSMMSMKKDSIESTGGIDATSAELNQIQDIRKEMDTNSKESRIEMESRLKEINKQMNE